MKIIFLDFPDKEASLRSIRSDAEIYRVIDDIIVDYKVDNDIEINISQELVLTAIRLAVVLGDIDYQDVKIEYNHSIITINKYGKLSSYPFSDIESEFSARILRKAIQIKRKDRELR